MLFNVGRFWNFLGIGHTYWMNDPSKFFYSYVVEEMCDLMISA